MFIFMVSQFAFAGYDVHVTKKEHWTDENDICINKADWKKYLETNSSIQVDHDSIEDSYLVYINNDEYAMWIDYKGCDLMTKNPNTEFINKLIEISKALDAKVQGDDGEVYITPDQLIYP